MIVDPVLGVFLALIFGLIFFIADFYEHKHEKYLHSSFIAGISITYFFILVLPEISEEMPEAPFNLEIFTFLFILIGFAFVHVSEKLIIQKVEGNSQKRIRKLLKMEKGVEMVERNIEIMINSEINEDILDQATLKHLGQTLQSLNEEQDKIMAQISLYKQKIQKHIHRDMEELRFITGLAYHFLIGIIIVGFLFHDFIAGVLFFIFAFLRTILINRSEEHSIFTDLEITEVFVYEENLLKELILASGVFFGIILGLIFEMVLPLNLELEMIFILYSFISGVIFYNIVREVLPEKEKGNPFLFLFGLILFTTIVFFLKIFTTIIEI